MGVVEKRTRVGFISRRGTVRAAGHEDRRNTFVVVRKRGGLDESNIIIGVLLGGVDLDADAAVGGQRFRGTDELVDIAGRRQFVGQLDAPRGDAQIEILLNLVDIIAFMRCIKHQVSTTSTVYVIKWLEDASSPAPTGPTPTVTIDTIGA